MKIMGKRPPWSRGNFLKIESKYKQKHKEGYGTGWQYNSLKIIFTGL
jgi:hypothetical protein